MKHEEKLHKRTWEKGVPERENRIRTEVETECLHGAEINFLAGVSPGVIKMKTNLGKI